ncbi:U2 snRNP complex subunit HSH155 NDAI_0C03570 [Naumovozyma dairenensis CBS 421]|uniref:Phosphatase PP2A regulatory subunit A/Splicing factor 3B subunit 1-like HEAT repeat domain-containing protein n=1 Tax=Naumovozyma dairenensis (strain ATCC 10597 / BCRC 20456 / CBS 421 / NBRC 0211 / NRRL Y-12639) TaxID=1071378 RepID=G0W8A6_NAUDC|nr:hypothetical protein NDAI_0C03570 [Naumovozyma dairenensis CBS 421]CCD24017.1 hypothetical protein NDAI_0C03570 [Naumovozyma dairenensis CBS 421]
MSRYNNGDMSRDKHQLVGNYSISQSLKESLHNEVAESEELDVLQKRMETRTIKHKESEYQARKFDRLQKEDDKANKKRPLRIEGKIEEAENKQLVKKRKSRWDVQSYQIPSATKTVDELIEQKSVTDEVPGMTSLRFFKPSDREHFAMTLEKRPLESLTEEEQKERALLVLLLKIKNGNAASRKAAMRTLTDKCLEFGPKLIFNHILPILLDKTLEDQERHLMIKVIDRILFKLGAETKPYVHQILVVVSPLLIDEDPMARTTGRDIISNLASACGLGTMITTLRADIDNEDEYIRNITSRTMAVVTKSFGVPNMLPFLKAVCHSTRSWRARHTGIKTFLQLNILLGVGILPYLAEIVECIGDGLLDEHTPVKIMTANTLASLAETSAPHGIEAFNYVLEPLWKGIRTHRSKVLAVFLKALGSIIPLMDPDYAGYYTEEVMRIVRREFNSPDDEMKKVVLLVLQKCCQTEGMTPKYLRDEIAPDFFKYFWNRRIALDLPINKLVTYTTVVLSEKLGCSFVVENLLQPLKNEAEPFRIMAIHAINRVVKQLGTAELSERQETRLIDALLIAFQEQKNYDPIVYQGFGTVALSLNTRMKPFLSAIISTILNLLKHKSQLARQIAADLCAILIPVIKNCNELEMLNKLNIILYESLGEIYPDVLGSIITAILNIVSVMDIEKIQPPINQILPTLTPILRNTHRKVQVSTIKLIGCIARRAPSYVSPKEWMRICFELLELLKSTNKAIRRSANSTFGEIAKAIGPQDVLIALLNNLKVQERQLRVCTAVAIGIVAETCGPYTVLPALMNEYKTPETNVQNGVLKALAFMFEYIGELAGDYVYVILPLLEDALIDRDLVHRQTASDVIKHLALNCQGTGHEDAFIHMLNLLMPNIFETSPHVIVRVLEGLESLGTTIGPGVYMNYLWGGLFHPAKSVRKAFWKAYNRAYIEEGDALVPYYPVNNTASIEIPELDIIL